MTHCLLTAARALLPFLAAEVVLLGVQWFLMPEDSWLSLALGSISLVILPLLAALRLTRLSFKTGPAVLSALSFTALGLLWAACAAALGYAGADWRPYLLGVVIAFALSAPVQLFAAYLGTRYARHTTKTAT